MCMPFREDVYEKLKINLPAYKVYESFASAEGASGRKIGHFLSDARKKCPKYTLYYIHAKEKTYENHPLKIDLFCARPLRTKYMKASRARTLERKKNWTLLTRLHTPYVRQRELLRKSPTQNHPFLGAAPAYKVQQSRERRRRKRKKNHGF